MIQKFAAVVLCFLFVLTAQAQSISLTYGSTSTGSIARPGAPVDFTFQGVVGDLVSIQVIPTADTLDAALTLIAPDGLQISTTPDNQLSQRLSTDGIYTLIVSGENDTIGDFVLRLDGQGDNATSLEVSHFLNVDFPVDAPPQIFRVVQAKTSQLILTISTQDPTFRFRAEVRNPKGDLIASFGGDIDQTALTFNAGSGVYEITVTAGDPALAGVVVLELQPGAVQTPVPTIIPPETTDEPFTGQILCHVSTNATANIRSAPSRDSDIIDRLTSTKAGDVIGISADDQWYALRLAEQTGWVSKEVTRETEPCGTLPILTESISFVTPTATPTITSTPTATATATLTAVPTATPTFTATFVPTIAPTQTFTPVPAVSTVATAIVASTEVPVSGTATPLPASAPADQDYKLQLDPSLPTSFTELVSHPIGDDEDHIDVQAVGLSAQTNSRTYTVILICNGEGVSLLRWGFDTTEPDLRCGNSTTVTFSRSLNHHDFLIALPEGPALVSYTLSFTP